MPWSKLAAIGDWSTVFPLRAVGIESHAVDDPAEAPKLLRQLAQSREFAVIFITEGLLAYVGDVMREFAESDLPAIIIIPEVSGSRGLGASIIRETMKKAAGRDIMAEEG